MDSSRTSLRPAQLHAPYTKARIVLANGLLPNGQRMLPIDEASALAARLETATAWYG